MYWQLRDPHSYQGHGSAEGSSTSFQRLFFAAVPLLIFAHLFAGLSASTSTTNDYEHNAFRIRLWNSEWMLQRLFKGLTPFEYLQESARCFLDVLARDLLSSGGGGHMQT